LEIAKKLFIVQIIASHKSTITTKPPSIDRPPKKTIDQRLLRINCKKNILKALFTPEVRNPFRHRRNAAIPIKVNKLIHAGAKTQLGGVKVGLLINAYHVGIERVVKRDPIIPAH
jgi:hypothetical protein